MTTSDSLLATFRATGAPEDQGRYLDALVNEGRLGRERVALAGGLIHPGARCSTVSPHLFAFGYRGRITTALESLSKEASALFALECAERILPAWTALRSSDDRVPRAVRASRDVAGGRVPPTTADAATAGASACVEELNRSLQGAQPSHATRAALAAATAALNAARAAAAEDDVLAALHGAAAAKAGADGAEDYLGEARWQVDRLCELLIDPTR